MRPIGGVSGKFKLLAAALIWTALSLPGLGYSEEFSQAGYRTPAYTSGVEAYRSGDYDKALAYFRQALSQGPDNSNAHYYLAITLDQLNRSAEAVPEFRYVMAHGREAKIVDYARTRLSELQPGTQPANESAPDMALIAAGNQVSPAIYRGSAARIAVPLKSNKNALMVDAHATNGRAVSTGTFIIDTGATYTSISQEMAEQLGLDLENCEKVYITTANGRIVVPKVMIETMNVNGLEAHNVEATVIQIRHGASFSGLLGLSFIRQFVLTIDPQAGQLIFQKN